MSDPFQDRAWLDYSARFRREVMPKILSSAMFLSVHSDDPDFDVQQATELGAALLLGKPLLLVVPRGRTLPDGLRRAGVEVIEDWDPADADSQTRLVEAIGRLQL